VEHNNQIERFNQLFADGPGARLTASSAPPSELYWRARLMGLYEAVLHETTGAVPLRGSDGLIGDVQVKRLSAWMNGPLGQPEQRKEILEGLDIEFRLRRLFHLTYRFEGDRALLSVVNAQIQLLEIVRAHLQDTLAAVVAPAIVQGQSEAESTAAIQAFWDTVRKAASASLEKALRYLPLAYRGAGSPSGIVTPLLPHYLRAFADALDGDEPVADSERANLVKELLEGPPRNGASLFLQLTDAYEKAALERCGPQYLKEYLAFEQQIDALRYPAELVSGMRQKDTIRIVRFSPRDAQRGFSARALENKVSGARLGHFAAFFKKAWRSNDILAGRLDATCQLFETLLDRSRVAEVVNNPDRRQDLRALIGTAQEPGDLGPEKLFPRSPEVDRHRLRAWLQDLTDESAEARKAALDLLGGPGVQVGQKGNELLDTLVAAAQLEILPESLEPVLQDAVGEQLAWNVLDTTDAPADAQAASATLAVSPRSGAFVRGRGQFNPTVAMVASGELARRSLEQIKPEQWRGFFLNEYGIGSERVETHIPRIVLLDLFARALLVVRNNLLGALGSRADAVSQHTLFRLFLDWPFRMLAHVAGVLRRSPARQTGFVVGALGHIAISIAVIVIGGKTVVYDSNVGLFLFVIAPVLLIGVLAGVLDRAEQASLLRRIWRGVKVLLALGAGVGGTAALVGLFFQPAGFTGWMTGLITKLPFVGSGSSTAGWLGVVPKVIAVALPVIAGFFLGRIGRKSPEDRLAAKLLEELKAKVAPERLGSIWYALTQKSRPRLFKLRGPGALVKFARRAHKLDVLERMIAANRNDAVTQLSQPPAAPGATANLPPAPVIDREALRKSLEDLSTEARRRIWMDFTEGERFPFRWWVPSQLMLQRAASDEQLVKLQGLVDRHAPRQLGVSLGAAP
jgi:hypothetical protein